MVAGDGETVDARYVRYEVTESLMGGILRKIVMKAPKEADITEYKV